MRIFLFFIALASVALSSCNKCKDVDLCPGDMQVSLKVTRTSDNADLLFGPNRRYDRSGLKLYSLNGRDTVVLPTLTFPRQHLGNNDTLLFADFMPPSKVVYLRLSATETETLSLNYRSEKHPCCGTIFFLDEVTGNNVSFRKDNDGTLVLDIKK